MQERDLLVWLIKSCMLKSKRTNFDVKTFISSFNSRAIQVKDLDPLFPKLFPFPFAREDQVWRDIAQPFLHQIVHGKELWEARRDEIHLPKFH